MRRRILIPFLALLVLPGPGWVTIILGLMILAREFAWAERMLERARRRALTELARVRRLAGVGTASPAPTQNTVGVTED